MFSEKQCNQCHISFPATTDYFYKNLTSIDGLYSLCKVCKKQYKKQWKTQKKISNREIINQALSRPCLDCGMVYPIYVMQFDHCFGEKLGDISQMLEVTEQYLRNEIAKCEIVCANCHCIRTWKRTHKE